MKRMHELTCKWSLVAIVLLSTLSPLFAQKKQLTLKDAILNRYYHLAPDYLWRLQWHPDGNYIYSERDKVMISTIKGEEKTLLELTAVNELLKNNQLDTLKYIPSIKWLGDNKIVFSSGKNRVMASADAKNLLAKVTLKKGAANIEYSEAGNAYAYTIDNNLWFSNSKGSKAITNESNKDIIFGTSVHRNEFGIHNGIFWSPKGSAIAFYRKDESMVADYPLVDYMVKPAKHTPIKYPMAGEASHHVTLGVYNIETGNTTYLKTGGTKDHFLTNISWSPDEKYILIQELNREQNHMQLNKYDAASGEFVSTLFEEKSDKYVEPQHALTFSKVDPEVFYYWARTDGYYHVYKYHISGKLIKQLTKGEWEVTKMIGFDAKERYMYVQATKESPIERHIYKVNTKSGKIEKLTNTKGTHSAMLSPNGKYLIDSYQAYDVPKKIDLITNSGKEVRNILTSKDNAAEYEFGENKIVEVPSTDGTTTLYGRVILPPNFDATKKYPVIVYVYGGPHSQLVSNTWHNSARWWQYYMAQKGYIAFTLDNRGTNNRGAKFETAIHRQLGIVETEDQMAGVNYLKSLPYVDQDRIGVHGWSFGGFMTLNMMLRHPDVFKVGVAGGPVVDWSMYEIMYGERYMDMPQENPEGYKNSDMSNMVGNLQGRLMLIHGVQDATVVMQHSFKFLRECVKQGKQVDFFPYVIHKHNVRGKERLHLMEKVSRYFEENL
ncbi:S9 family peptidase [Prolixibacteraceae bacterium JC049]|nr:S9 family peptidase [Prolixibacteraceae bacterium JC049]